MKTGTVTKLMFTGIASGIALSCAVVLATSVTTIATPKADRSDVASPQIQSAADPKADRQPSPAERQEVARGGKTDALDITIAILNGKDIVPDNPAPFPGELETVAVEAPGTDEPRTDAPADNPVVINTDEAGGLVAEQPVPAAVPRTRTVKITRPLGDPVAIIPTPEPVESRPVAAPNTTTNFTVEPLDSPQSLRNRSDLDR